MKRRIKLELILAILMTFAIASSAIYASLPRNPDNRTVSYLRSKSVDQYGLQGTSIQQVITENIQGQLSARAYGL